NHTACRLAALGHQRPPAPDLLHVLQADDPRLADAGPLDRHPGQVANLFFAGLPAGGLAVVSAIRAGVEPAQGPTSQYLGRVDFPYVRLQVQGARVVGLVHADRSRIVVDGDVYWSAQPHFQAGACPAAAGEQIHIDLFIMAGKGQGILGAKNSHGLPSIFWRSMERSSAFCCSRSAMRSAGSPEKRSVVMAGLLLAVALRSGSVVLPQLRPRQGE